MTLQESSFLSSIIVQYTIYLSDSSQLALKYLKDTEANLNNVLIMMGNFNIRNCLWDSNFRYYFLHRNTLFDITNSFQLEISRPTKFLPTRYSDNGQDSNSVLDFVFFQPNLTKQNNHHIHPDWRLTSDHAPISVNISIAEEYIQTTKQVLAKNSEEKDYFIKELINFIKNLKTDSILDSNIVVATTRHKVQ